MDFPVEFAVGRATIPAHLVFEMLSYTVGYQLYIRQRKRTTDRISDENRIWILIGAAAGALAGSHTLGIFERPLPVPGVTVAYFMANKTVLGGFLGGLAGVEITKKFLRVTASSGDLMTYPIIAGLAVGRIGCHLAGLTDGTHGSPSNLPWAMDFGDGIRRHPVNLYEILFLGFLAGLIFVLERRGKGLRDGDRFKVFMIGYLVWRFVAEWMKPVYFWGVGLTTIQMAALAGLAYYGMIGGVRGARFGGMRGGGLGWRKRCDGVAGIGGTRRSRAPAGRKDQV